MEGKGPKRCDDVKRLLPVVFAAPPAIGRTPLISPYFFLCPHIAGNCNGDFVGAMLST
jgi:hypothetical protein